MDFDWKLCRTTFYSRYVLAIDDGFQVALIDYGATIQSIQQVDKQDQISEITLGYDTLQGRLIDEMKFKEMCILFD